MFVAEKQGRLLVVDPHRATPTEVLDISNHVNTFDDRGLLGVAVDPNYKRNHFVYLLYTYEDNPADYVGPKVSRLTRVLVSPSDTVAGGLSSPTETVVLGAVSSAPCPAASNSNDCLPADGEAHSGDTVRAAPDGTLWVSNGDGAGDRTVDGLAFRAYDETSYAGKILHVDRAGNGLPGHPFCPADDTLTDVCTKVYALGFRNPFRFSLTPGAGPVVGDVGWTNWEEIDFVTAGGNYGWPCWEGLTHTPGYSSDPRCSDPNTGIYTQSTVPPVYVFDHSHPGPFGLAVVAGPTYTGTGYPAGFAGTVFFGAYGGGFVRRLVVNDARQVTAVEDFATGVPALSGLESAPRTGDLVYVDIGKGTPGSGSVHEIVYASGPAGPQTAAGPPGPPAHAPHTDQSLGPAAGRSGATVRINRRRLSRKRHVYVLTGTAANPAGVRGLEVALAAGAGPSLAANGLHARCRWLTRGRAGRRNVVRACLRPVWLRAKLAHPGARHTAWHLALPQPLSSGSYTLYFRAMDAHGVLAPGFADGASVLRVGRARQR
jgi:glucose/arabinose dehydrogenase